MSKINQKVFICSVLFNVPATILITFMGSHSDTDCQFPLSSPHIKNTVEFTAHSQVKILNNPFQI